MQKYNTIFFFDIQGQDTLTKTVTNICFHNIIALNAKFLVVTILYGI